MDLYISPAIWQLFIDKVLEDMFNYERYKVIMDGVMIFSGKTEHKQDFENMFKPFVKLSLWIWPQNCQPCKTKFVYMVMNIMDRKGKLCYTHMK